MKALSALYIATAREFLRDRMAILLTTLLPLLMAGFFGLVFSKGGSAAAPDGRQIPMAHLYVAGMLSIAMLWLGVFGTAPPLVQLRELQILRRIAVTPVSRRTLVGAQVAWRLTTGCLQAVLLVGFGMAAYGLRISGNWFLVLAAVLLGAAAMVSMGVLLAGLARTNESVVALGQVVQFPMMFLSGSFMPLDMLPDFLRPVSLAMPLTYLTDALKQAMLGAAPLFPLWLDFTVLGGSLLVLAGLAVWRFRWE